MQTSLRRCAALAVFVLAGAVSVAQDGAEDDEVLRDDWFVVFQAGARTGWAHERTVRTTEGGLPVLVTDQETFLSGAPSTGERMEKPIVASQRFVEDEAGKVLRYETSFDMAGKLLQKRSGRLDGDEMVVVEDGKERRVPYPAGALGLAAAERAIVGDGLVAGRTGSAERFAPGEASLSERVSWAVNREERLDLIGRLVRALRVVRKDPTTIDDVLWMDERGRDFGGSTNMGTLVSLLTEERLAKTEADPRTLALQRAVAPDRAISLDSRPVRAAFRLSRGGKPVGTVPAEGGQRVKALAGGALEIEVDAIDLPAGSVATYKRPWAGPEDMKQWLAPGPLVECDDSAMREMADLAVSEMEDALHCARAIEWFVRAYFTKPCHGPGFASALEVIDSREGDPSEAAVMAVGLARYEGLPARLVAGLAYFPTTDPPLEPPVGVFGPHFWAEVYIGDGRWYPIDPSRAHDVSIQKHIDDLVGHGGFDATHIALLRSDLSTATPVTDLLFPVLDFLDGLEVRVLR